MIFLAEFSVHDGVSASTKYTSTDGYTSKPSDTPATQYYMPRLKGAGSIERHIFSGGDGVSGGNITGGSSTNAGSISVVNGKPSGWNELIDDWRLLAFNDITIRSLVDTTQPLTQAKTRFVGKASHLVSTNALENYDVVIYDRREDLDRPILVNAYLGTTTAGGQGTVEGNVDLKDKIKQKVWGTCNSVDCIDVNPFDLVRQVSDGAVTSIAVYDGGVALTNDGNVANLAALFAATILPGHYLTCVSLGLFRLGGSPAGAVTANVVEGSSAALRTRAQIASRMIAWHQAMYAELSLSLSATDVTALDVLSSAEYGIIVKETESALSALSRLLGGAWILPQSDSASVFNIGRFDAPAGVAVKTYDLDDNLGGSPERIETGDEGKGIPAYKVIVKYDQLDVVQGANALFGVVQATEPTRAAYLGQEWRQQTAEDSGLLDQYQNSPTITIETRLISQAAAAAEATRLLALYGTVRDMYRIRVPMSDDPEDDPGVGDVVELISRNGRMGLGTTEGSGKLFLVTGRVDDFADIPILTLELWG